MRGPGLRTHIDVRRLWRCPQCGYERRAHGTETTVHCHCNSEQPLMKLIEGKRPYREIYPDPDPYIVEVTDDQVDDLAESSIDEANPGAMIEEEDPSESLEDSETAESFDLSEEE